MRDFSQAFATHLASGATTLAWCWKIVRIDDVVLGFTDHDATISFDGVVFDPASGLDGSETVQRIGAQTQTAEVIGVLTSDAISTEDIALGRFDGARVESWRVNWREPGERALMRVDTIGEITREDGVFRAELRSAQHAMNVPGGRLYQHVCDARLGDKRCGIYLDDPKYRASVTVTQRQGPAAIGFSGLSEHPEGWFEQAIVRWTSGRRAGLVDTVAGQAGDTLSFAGTVADWVDLGDTGVVRTGCDKQFKTCRTKFGNGANFQGFPHIPGNDFVLRYPSTSDRLDGERVVR